MNHANTILLIRLGFHVIEHRARRKNKTLTDWMSVAAFKEEDEADDYLAKFQDSGYYRAVCDPAHAKMKRR